MNKLIVIFEPDGEKGFQKKFTFTQEINTNAHLYEVHEFGKNIAKVMGFDNSSIEKWFGKSWYDNPEEWSRICSESLPWV